ncbi:hypothetical protein ALC57_17471 [Trachymyrmex cornetzi]|uniref:DUF8207 domain-containing protein n=1 Tax=Trachymyrmex cornetzi TaxID=471704 RepID=A0A151ITM7_9HYME|nr:hypothetical protein ALC57_17471 [Trachymyrmex cornetzi]
MADVRKREKIAREIEKTRESIRKKHRALKTGKIEGSIALDRHFKLLIESLRLFVDSPGERATKRELRDEDAASVPKRERKEEKKEQKEGEEASETFEPSATLHKSTNGAQDKESAIDHVYGVYLHKDGWMFGNKRFDVDDADNIIIDGVRYDGTPGLYELIFKRMSDDALYTEDDMRKYKSMLLVTGAHKHKHHSQGRLLSKGIQVQIGIAPSMLVTPKKQSKKSGKGLPRAMTLNDNAIDYVHWDDPNELVDRLQLLDASHRAGNNAHDNEMQSIIEELREAGLIIN